MPVIRLRRAVGGNALARLRPGRGVKTVRVNDAADVLERAVKRQMGRRVGTGFERALDDAAGFQRNHHHLFRRQAGVRHAGRLDDHQVILAFHRAGIAPGLDDQAIRDQLQIRVTNLFLQFFEHFGRLRDYFRTRLRMSISRFITS